MKERVLAILGAIALVAVAVLIRSALVGDGEQSSNSGGGSGGDRPVVACTADLMTICEALEADERIAKNSPTLDLDGASDPDAGIDAWITWDPAPQIANFDAGEPAVWQAAEPLGQARLSIAGTSAELSVACPDGVAWACLANVPAVNLTVGVGKPTTSEGLARLSPLAQTLAEDLDPASLSPAAQGLVLGPVQGQFDAATMATQLVTFPGRSNFVVGPAAVLEARVQTEQGRARQLTVTDPAPAAAATIVIAPRRDGGADRVVDACDPDDESSGFSDALRVVGATKRCAGTLADEQLAGFLFQVREKVS